MREFLFNGFFVSMRSSAMIERAERCLRGQRREKVLTRLPGEP